MRIFVLLACVIVLPGCCGKGMRVPPSTKPSPAPAPVVKKAPVVAAAPACQAATASVSANILRDRPCASSCSVVVNAGANTTGLCLEWSPVSFWDGLNCVCRCELLGGVMDSGACMFEGVGITQYNKSATALYLAPIQCGAWLGARDSAWNMSLFASDCFSILENRFQTDAARLSACDVDRYTAGCRFLETNQRWVPECRISNLTECGVKVACPSPNPCGLGPDIGTNLNKNISLCTPQTHLALNVSATEENCYSWDKYAFLLDGYCVASCGRMDNQCVLNGVGVPPCVRNLQDNSVHPEICSVPMPSDTFSGFRNGFYGMSRVRNSQCLATLANCSSSFWSPMCFDIEGLYISPLEFAQSSQIPVCVGDASIQCKIEYPCPDPDIPFRCDAVLGISQEIYTRLNVYDCDWFKIRDGIIIGHWILTFIGPCIYSTVFDGKLPNDYLVVLIFLVLIGCSFVWEFAWAAFLLGLVCVGLFRVVMGLFRVVRQQSPPTRRPNDVAGVPLDPTYQRVDSV